jgi:hypothetical protein
MSDGLDKESPGCWIISYTDNSSYMEANGRYIRSMIGREKDGDTGFRNSYIA